MTTDTKKAAKSPEESTLLRLEKIVGSQKGCVFLGIICTELSNGPQVVPVLWELKRKSLKSQRCQYKAKRWDARLFEPLSSTTATTTTIIQLEQ